MCDKNVLKVGAYSQGLDGAFLQPLTSCRSQSVLRETPLLRLAGASSPSSWGWSSTTSPSPSAVFGLHRIQSTAARGRVRAAIADVEETVARVQTSVPSHCWPSASSCDSGPWMKSLATMETSMKHYRPGDDLFSVDDIIIKDDSYFGGHRSGQVCNTDQISDLLSSSTGKMRLPITVSSGSLYNCIGTTQWTADRIVSPPKLSEQREKRSDYPSSKHSSNDRFTKVNDEAIRFRSLLLSSTSSSSSCISEPTEGASSRLRWIDSWQGLESGVGENLLLSGSRSASGHRLVRALTSPIDKDVEGSEDSALSSKLSAFQAVSESFTNTPLTLENSEAELSTTDKKALKVKMPHTSIPLQASNHSVSNSSPLRSNTLCEYLLDQKDLRGVLWVSLPAFSIQLTVAILLVILNSNRVSHILCFFNALSAFAFLLGSLAWQTHAENVRIASHQIVRFMMTAAAVTSGGAFGFSILLIFAHTYQVPDQSSAYVRTPIGLFPYDLATWQPLALTGLSVVWMAVSVWLYSRIIKGETLPMFRLSRLFLASIVCSCSLTLTLCTAFASLGVVLVGILATLITLAPVLSTWWCVHLTIHVLHLEIGLLGIMSIAILLNVFLRTSSQMDLWVGILFPLIQLILVALSSSQGALLHHVVDVRSKESSDKSPINC